MSNPEYQLVGSGINVYEQAVPAEGIARWLDSPDAVMELVMSGDIDKTIGISRGGTTTFMAPALASGIAGLITLQGAPESHLGILSREFGIPCVMSVSFTDGVQTERGETIPADGTKLRLDVSDPSSGRVLASADGA
jgi:PEP-utilising enzyme, mobile domain